MKKAEYTILNPSQNVFHFVSVGSKGQILKLVQFQPIGKNLYNLVLADYSENEETWSDMSNSNNGDLSKVLTTVIHIVYLFLKENEEAIVYLEANTHSKNLLYNRVIANNIEDLSLMFNILGEKDNVQKDIELGILFDCFYIYYKPTKQ